MMPKSANPVAAKVGLEPRGAVLAIATGACLGASYALLQDHDLRRTKKSVAGTLNFPAHCTTATCTSRTVGTQTVSAAACVCRRVNRLPRLLPLPTRLSV